MGRATATGTASGDHFANRALGLMVYTVVVFVEVMVLAQLLTLEVARMRSIHTLRASVHQRVPNHSQHGLVVHAVV